MLTTPTLHEVAQGHRGMLRGIEAALDAQCMVSAVDCRWGARQKRDSGWC